jgi:leader peptidase (prepilin peptidase)/N-methyltransferase
MSASRDVGLEVLDFVSISMQIDDRWSVRGTRGLTWWGHRLAQRITAEPVRHSDGFEVARLSAETDLLRNVPSTRQTAERIAAFNHHATLNAFIWDPDAGSVRLRCSAGVNAETLDSVKRLFGAAVSIQVADAHIKVDGLAKLLGGEPDVSNHPRSGPRPEMDDMLNVIELLYARKGQQPTPFTPADFARAARLEPAPWCKVSCDDGALNAVMHAKKYPSGTGVLFATATRPHPQLGSGLFMLLTIPTPCESDITLALCHELNLAEAHAWEIPYCFGAWCPQRPVVSGLAYVTFVPTAVCRPGLIEAMSIQMGARAAWARQQLDEGFEDTRAYAAAVQASRGFSSAASSVRQAFSRTLEWNAQEARTRLAVTRQNPGSSQVEAPGRASPADTTPKTAPRPNVTGVKTSPVDAVITGGVAAIAFLLAVLTLPEVGAIARAGLFIGVSTVLVVINLRTGVIPDRITLPTILIGLLTSFASQHPGPLKALLGVLVGGGTVFVLIVIIRGGLGGGIMRMAAMVGAFLGWHLTIFALVLSFFIAGVGAWFWLRLWPRGRRDQIQFAPYLAIAAVIGLLAGDRLIEWSFGLFGSLE